MTDLLAIVACTLLAGLLGLRIAAWCLSRSVGPLTDHEPETFDQTVNRVTDEHKATLEKLDDDD